MAEDRKSPTATPLSKEGIDAAKRELLLGVGYGNPPLHGRFQKGQSGNPKGRPRKAAVELSLSDQPMLDAVLRGADKTVRVREGDQINEVGIRDAIVQALVSSALKGNARSLGLLIDLTRTADEARIREIRERNDFWKAYQDKASSAVAVARAAGQPEPALVPHPDDVVLDPVNGPKFIGPFTEAEQQQLQERLALRDLLIMQNVLDERRWKPDPGWSDDQPDGALFLAEILNRSIPCRLRLDDLQIIVMQMKHERLSTRELTKALYARWSAINPKIRRGALFGSRKRAVELVSFVCDFLSSAQAKKIDVDAIQRGDFDEAAQELLERHGR